MLTVFAAASLGPTLETLVREFHAANPQVEVRLELGPSRVACLKVSSLGREADIVFSADAELIDSLLIPAYASFNILFATNALVLAYPHDGRVAQHLATGTPWQKVLHRPDVVVGIANPELAPVGYRALLALELNDLVAPPALRLGHAIRTALRPEHERPDVAKLLAPLETGELDAAIVYRSEASEHGLAMTHLDRRIDFSDPEQQTLYHAASVALRDGSTVHGSVALYGLTIPTNAPQANLARLFVNHLLSESGRTIAAAHFLPLLPVGKMRIHGHVPPGLLAQRS